MLLISSFCEVLDVVLRASHTPLFSSFQLCYTHFSFPFQMYELPVEKYSSSRVKWLLSKWPKDSDGDGLEPVGSLRGKLMRAWSKIRSYVYRFDPRELFYENLFVVSTSHRLIMAY